MSAPILNIDDVDFVPRPAALSPTGPAAERYDSKMGAISTRIGAQHLGYNVTVVPAGKRAFPMHNHWVNEEMAYVLSGTGEVTIGDTTYPIQPGDFIAFPPGNQASAHQITNTGVDELQYLAVSTKLTPEICEYPNSGKFGILGESPAGSDGTPSSRLMFIGRHNQSGDYWEGE